METTDTSKSKAVRYFGIAAIVLSIGIAYCAIGYGYKQIKDADYLNTNPEQVYYSKGTAHMKVSSDKVIISFSLIGSGQNQKEAAIKLKKLETDFLSGVDASLKSSIHKVNTIFYEEGDKVLVSKEQNNYEIVLENKSVDDIQAARSQLLPFDVEYLSIQYTLIDKEKTFKMLTEKALEDAKAKAEDATKILHVHLGDIMFVAVGEYDQSSGQYLGDTADYLFDNMMIPTIEAKQTVYVNYKIK